MILTHTHTGDAVILLSSWPLMDYSILKLLFNWYYAIVSDSFVMLWCCGGRWAAMLDSAVTFSGLPAYMWIYVIILILFYPGVLKGARHLWGKSYSRWHSELDFKDASICIFHIVLIMPLMLKTKLIVCEFLRSLIQVTFYHWGLTFWGFPF